MNKIIGKIMLLAEVLYSNMGCPKCGGEKSENARTCRKCFEEIGAAATKAVDEVVFTCARAVIGHNAAISTKNAYKRDVVWGPILCQVKIEHALYKEAGNGVSNYWDCSIYTSQKPHSGYLSLFVFGGGEYGEEVTVLLEKKTKKTPKGTITYFRGQIVEGVTSNVRLHVGTYASYDQAGYVEGLPHERQVELGRSWSVGFVPVDATADETKPVQEEANQASATV